MMMMMVKKKKTKGFCLSIFRLGLVSVVNRIVNPFSLSLNRLVSVVSVINRIVYRSDTVCLS
jgi:hypothetical protein